MSFSTRHLDRERAESFGGAAEDYDRYRPDYPPAVFDDLAGLGDGQVVDVGCGTGKASAALAARGRCVYGIEPDERMARIARGRGLAVETARFETWTPARRFAMVVSADAWHWMHPRNGPRKAAEILEPGGYLARFWSFHVLEEPLLVDLGEVYRQCAPGVAVGGGRQRSTEGVRDPLEDHEEFTPVAQHTYRWSLTMDTDTWTGLIGTFSDHLRMPPTARKKLFTAVRAVIDAHGGTVRTDSGTFLQLARRR
ncbi:class I SAM-dependent methyltransferase [Streptomyces coelicoflavus]|uniref:class I SAM-dependent methyltransferase n=1 Tax=Streptomyces coelicoflavus TaxID=285562 RepID=UPI0036A1AAF7